MTFDLATGQVRLEGAAVLVPPAALIDLLERAGTEATLRFGRVLGGSIGTRLARRFATDGDDSGASGVRTASLESVVEHLGGELAIAGHGSLGLERWGHALVAVVDHAPLGAAGDALLESVLGAAIATATGRSVQVARLDRQESRARFLVAGSAAVDRVRGWIAAGMPWGEALVRLHAAGTPA